MRLPQLAQPWEARQSPGLGSIIGAVVGWAIGKLVELLVGLFNDDIFAPVTLTCRDFTATTIALMGTGRTPRKPRSRSTAMVVSTGSRTSWQNTPDRHGVGIRSVIFLRPNGRRWWERATELCMKRLRGWNDARVDPLAAPLLEVVAQFGVSVAYERCLTLLSAQSGESRWRKR